MIPVTNAPLTDDVIASLNKLAIQETRGSARFKKVRDPRPTKRSTTRRT